MSKTKTTTLQDDVRELEKLSRYALRSFEKIHDRLVDDADPAAALRRVVRAVERLDAQLDKVATRRALDYVRGRAEIPKTPHERTLEKEALRLEAAAGAAVTALFELQENLENEEDLRMATVTASDVIIALEDELAPIERRRAFEEASRAVPASRPIVKAGAGPASEAEIAAS